MKDRTFHTFCDIGISDATRNRECIQRITGLMLYRNLRSDFFLLLINDMT